MGCSTEPIPSGRGAYGDQLLFAGGDDPLALPLLKQGSRPIIVNISSILGHRGVPYNSGYCATKFAVQGFSESIRAEFTRLGIDVLVVSPGTTETEFFDSVLEHTAKPGWPEHKPVSAAAVARQTVRAIRRGGTKSFRIAGAACSAGSTASRRGWSTG